MSPARIHPEETIWTTEYLLLHCQGYRVESIEGRLGYVGKVVRTRVGHLGRAGVARVLTDAGNSRDPDRGDVLDLHPNGKRLVGADAARTKR